MSGFASGPWRPPAQLNLGGWYLVMGIAYQVIYHGFRSPFALDTLVHVFGWPIFVLLGLLRWVFIPFAVVALVLMLLALAAGRR